MRGGVSRLGWTSAVLIASACSLELADGSAYDGGGGQGGATAGTGGWPAGGSGGITSGGGFPPSVGGSTSGSSGSGAGGQAGAPGGTGGSGPGGSGAGGNTMGGSGMGGSGVGGNTMGGSGMGGMQTGGSGGSAGSGQGGSGGDPCGNGVIDSGETCDGPGARCMNCQLKCDSGHVELMPDGYHCYFYEVMKKDWNKARKHCTDRDADLVTFQFPQEETVMTTHFGPDAGDNPRWLGLTDKKGPHDPAPGSWEWVDGTAYPTSGGNLFADTQSEPCGSDTCYEHRAAYVGQGDWRDRHESAKYEFACEVDPIGSL